MKVRLFGKIKSRTDNKNYKCRSIYVLNRVVFSYERNKRHPHEFDHILYLKVNRQVGYTLLNIQHWVNIAEKLNAYIYFVCDRESLKFEILSRVVFHDGNFCFIKSMRKALEKIVENISTEYWRKATFAHLTTIYHAANNGYKNVWSIDADDTMICEYPENVAAFLKNVMVYSEAHDISAISLDMWRSRTLGKHWSMGIVYVRDVFKVQEKIETLNSRDWFKRYKSLDVNSNLDWLFNYFKDSKALRVESFYFEQAFFIHWGEFIRNPQGTAFCYWEDGKLVFPIFNAVFKGLLPPEVDIADCIEIPSDFSFKRSQRFINNEISTIKFFPDELLRLNNIPKIREEVTYWF